MLRVQSSPTSKAKPTISVEPQNNSGGGLRHTKCGQHMCLNHKISSQCWPIHSKPSCKYEALVWKLQIKDWCTYNTPQSWLAIYVQCITNLSSPRLFFLSFFLSNDFTWAWLLLFRVKGLNWMTGAHLCWRVSWKDEERWRKERLIRFDLFNM